MTSVDSDQIFRAVGGFGRFQVLYYLCLCWVILFSVFSTSYIFIARDVKYRCKIKICDLEDNEYNPTWLPNAVPFKDDEPSRCLYFKNNSNETCSNFDHNVTARCNEFIHERDEITIVHDFGITCDENLWKLTMVGTIAVLGELVCLSFSGLISDHYGRKFMITISVALSCLMGILRSFSTSYVAYVVLQFLDTALSTGMYSGAFILALELVDSNKRNMANTVTACAYAVGQILLALSMFLAQSWRRMLLILYTPGILIAVMLLFVPESARWLIAKGRTEEALTILKSIAKANGVQFKTENFDHPSSKPKKISKTVPIVAVLKSKTLFWRIVHCSLTWIGCNFPYFGMNIQSVALSENIYINFISTTLVEVPGYIVMYILIDRIGRRKTFSFGLIVTAMACVTFIFIESGSLLSLIIFLVGKFSITVSHTVLYVYTAEMFPTSARNSAFALCSMFGRLGSMLAPQVPIFSRLSKSLPSVIFASASLLCGISGFWFPETLNTNLPEEIYDAECIDKDQSKATGS